MSLISEVSKPKSAVLIDTENAQAACIHEVLKEIDTFGNAIVRRAYGDWYSHQNMMRI